MTERHYRAIRYAADGPWHMTLTEGDHTVTDTCDDEHKASCREALEQKLDAKIRGGGDHAE